LEGPGFDSRQENRRISHQKCPDWLWGSVILLLNGWEIFFLEG